MTEVRRIALGEQRVEGVFFVRAPLTPPQPHRIHGTGRPDLTHVSTDDLTKTAHIRQVLVDLIAAATEKVLFCSFLFADEQVVDALCAAAERLQGGVYILTALDKHLRAEVLDLDDDLDTEATKLQERARRHEQQLQRLAHAGAWLRSANDCHAKFCVVDDAHAVVTSANATAEAYESNPEDGLVLHHPQTARELGRLFAHVWQHLAAHQSIPGARLDVHTLGNPPPPTWRQLEHQPGLRAVATLRQQETSLLKAAIDVIDQAESRLAIATYSFAGMESHPIGEALQRALLKQEMEIDLLVRPRNNVPAQRATCGWLLALAPDRVRLHGHGRTHTKSIVADNSSALLWTGNLEAAHGWDNGIEVGVRTDDAGTASAIAAWTGDVMRRSTHRVLVSPSTAELVQHGERCALAGAWSLHLPSGVDVDRVSRSLERSPVELVETRSGQALRCGNQLLMDVRLDESEHRIDASGVRDATSSGGARSRGWAANCVLEVIGAAEVERSTGPDPSRNRRGASKRRWR